MLKVTENSILVCGPGTKIKRLEVLNAEYNYNMTCSGIVARKRKFNEGYISAIFAKRKGKDEEEEEAVDLDTKDYYAISHFNQGLSIIFYQLIFLKLLFQNYKAVKIFGKGQLSRTQSVRAISSSLAASG